MSAAFVRNVSRPGRYGDGQGRYGLSLLVRKQVSGRVPKTRTRDVFNYETVTHQAHDDDHPSHQTTPEATPTADADPCPGDDSHPVSEGSTTCHSHPVLPCHATDTVTYQAHDDSAATGHTTVTLQPCPTVPPESTPTTSPAPAGVPVPQGFTAQCSSSGRYLVLRWTPITVTGNSRPAYEVEGLERNTVTMWEDGLRWYPAELGKTYQIKMRANVSNQGTSGYTPVITAACLRAAPSGFTATCADDGTVTATWNTYTTYSGGNAFNWGFQLTGDLGTYIMAPNVPFNTGYPLTETNAFSGWVQPQSGRTYNLTLVAAQITGEQTNPTNTTVTCPLLVPTGLTVSCSDFGVVTVSWNEVPGAQNYALEGPINYPEGSPEHTTMNAQRLEGQTITGVQVKAKADGRWSDPSDEAQSVTCKERDMSSWNSPNTTTLADCSLWALLLGCANVVSTLNLNDALAALRGAPPKEQVFNPILVQTSCETTETNGQKIRTCTEIWDEYHMIRIDEGAGWRDIPITNWDTDTFGENISSMGDIVDSLDDGFWTVITAGMSEVAYQYKGFMTKDRDNAVYVTMFAYPTAYGANPSDHETCWIGYTQQSDILIRETETIGAYTNHRDITVYYCSEND